MLFLIFFVFANQLFDFANAVNIQPNTLQNSWVVPLHELWANKTSIGAISLFDETLNCIWLECHVVVQQTKEASLSVDKPGDFIGHQPEAWIALNVTDHSLRQNRMNEVG